MESINTGLGTKIKVMDFRNPVWREGLKRIFVLMTLILNTTPNVEQRLDY